MAPFIGGEADPTLLDERSESWKLSTNASAVSDAPDYRAQVGPPRCAGRVRYSCLREAARGEALMQIQWCRRGEKAKASAAERLRSNRLRGRLRYTPNEAGNILMEMVSGILTLRLVCDAEY
jgi:hypothetical protein